MISFNCVDKYIEHVGFLGLIGNVFLLATILTFLLVTIPGMLVALAVVALGILWGAFKTFTFMWKVYREDDSTC